jgi:GTP cyclohydrolase-4
LIDLIDVQAEKPTYTIPVSRVGVRGIKYPVRVKRGDREIDLLTEIDIFVNLPSTRKGADFSRKIEAINEIILARKVVPSIEELSSEIAKKTLEKLNYSTNCDVSISADYLVEKRSPNNAPIIKNYKILGETHSNNNGKKTMVGVVVQGINACPCAMETTRALISKDFPGNDELLSKIPTISHNQRNLVTLKIGVPTGKSVEADELIELAEKVLGGSLYSLLKRIDEGNLVYNAHKNPKFVEDIVREIAILALEKYSDFPDDTKLYIESRSEESIHPHDAFAAIDTDFGEIRRSLKA